MIVAKRYWYYDSSDLSAKSVYTVKPIGNTSFSMGFYSSTEAEGHRLFQIMVLHPKLYMFDYRF